MTALGLAGLSLLLVSQEPPARPVENQKKTEPVAARARPSFVLKVTGGVLGTADIQAKQTETKAILDRLKVDLKIPLVATRLVAEHRVDLALKNTPTTALLLSLAPVVLADLEVSAIPDEVVWTGIHLLGYGESEPARALKQSGFLIMAGIPPEDGSGSSAEAEAKAKELEVKGLAEEPKDANKPMLTVIVTDGSVSVRARQQPLVAVLNEIAVRSQIPFDIRGSVDMDLLDIELRDTPLRDLPVAIGRPGIRLVVRRDLASGTELVHGIIVGNGRPPASEQ